MDEAAFQEALKLVKIPVLPLDQKWHRLFALSGKPEDVAEIEQRLDDLIKRQGQLNTDLKALKNEKALIQKQIVENIRGAEGSEDSQEEEKNLDDFKQKIEELNQKIEETEDALKDMPRSIYETNRELMMSTMTFCYDNLRVNDREIKEITDWITDFKAELKKNLIRKQNREINNREMYSYMHDIFGMDVLTLFDIRYETAEEQRMKELTPDSEQAPEPEDLKPDTVTIYEKMPQKQKPVKKENFNV